MTEGLCTMLGLTTWRHFKVYCFIDILIYFTLLFTVFIIRAHLKIMMHSKNTKGGNVPRRDSRA